MKTHSNAKKCYDENMPKDSNGKELQTGDSVTVIKDLKVGSSSQVLKRGQVFKNIRVDEYSDTTIEVKDGRSTLVLKTEFLKKL